MIAAAKTLISEMQGRRRDGAAAPDTRSVPVLTLVALTAAATDPIVGLGAGAALPFMARAVSESRAKPTAGGL